MKPCPTQNRFTKHALRQNRNQESERTLYELQSQDDVARCPGGAGGCTSRRASSHGRSSEEGCSELVFLRWPERDRAATECDRLEELRRQAGAGGAGGYIGVFNRNRGEIPGFPDHRNQAQL